MSAAPHAHERLNNARIDNAARGGRRAAQILVLDRMAPVRLCAAGAHRPNPPTQLPPVTADMLCQAHCRSPATKVPGALRARLEPDQDAQARPALDADQRTRALNRAFWPLQSAAALGEDD